jgi:transposase
MWTSKNRARYDRSKLRYPSDLTDDEWGLVEPLIPPGKTDGGKRTVIMREVVNGLMYILSTGCQWRAISKDLAPKSSVYGYFDLWLGLFRTHPTSAVLSDAGYFAKHVTLSLALRSSGDAGRGFGRDRAAATLVA